MNVKDTWKNIPVCECCREPMLPTEHKVCGDCENMLAAELDGEPLDIDDDSYWEDHDIYGGGSYCGEDY